MEQNSHRKMPDIQKSIEIKAPIAKVWQTISTSEGLAAWLMQNDFQPIVGHEFSLHGRYGPTPCKVLEINPPYRVSFSWDNFGWQVSFELKELARSTLFTVIHSGWGESDELVPKANEKNSKIRDIMELGWEHHTENLQQNFDKDEE